MIVAQQNVAFEALAINATPGLVGTLTVEVYDPTDGTSVLAATTDGITEPRPGTYRASLTVPTVGSYMLRWTAPGPAYADEELRVVEHTVADVTDVRPTVQDVATLLNARTFSGGRQLGTFTDATTPTDAQVDGLIDVAVSDVLTRVGVTIPDSMLADASRLVALQAATLVEASFFPNQLDTDRSAYTQYQAMYLNGIASLIEAARSPNAMRLH